ncbi:Myc-type, basic helix-loop-helix (bHLH) domain,Transcription regulator Myc [Cinara cedri]|uniref:Myc-type, basic helix-loop-helix (BHLH) domain,Transcription regulator Myc n=1 Tax=Cinara cedri TaxID=506608 RepID=A0A5E4MT75_9HEMI|nr:Myc-type, basic helix-loop-helix (bHLH) domain,Transcription regulator Myc [Cinara cedri]
MSDNEHDVEAENAEKRAHHNELERKRRDNIKNSFTSLRHSIPSLQSQKVASRASILKKAADYILSMRRRNISHQQDIDDLKRQNVILESQIKTLEKAKATGNYAMNTHKLDLDMLESENSDTSDDELQKSREILKKQKFGQ